MTNAKFKKFRNRILDGLTISESPFLMELFSRHTPFFIRKKLVLGELNGQVTFSTQATEVKKLVIFSFIFLLQC